ncbi:MAG: hypothetical protein Q7U66_18865 [Methylobacter sp.]|nr:hypothetical protein [Methylobacter sp.]
MKTITQLAMLTVLLFAAETAIAANYFIRAGAAGSNNGNDWTNAYTSLPSTLVRGDTYYIAGGSYSGRTFNTPASGTSVITIKGATIADHGTDTGWSATYSVENTQATWTSGITFNTSYWIFDGSVGPNWSKTTSQYGFKFNPVNYVARVYNLSSAISDVKISHITATAPTGDVEKFFLSTDNETKSVNNVTFSYCLLNGWSNAVWATSDGLLMNNWLVEYNVILNGYSSAAVHGEDINNNYGHLDNLTVRYNWFEGRIPSTGSIVVLNGPAGPYYIYGNVFKNMKGGDGIITGVHYPLSGAIYNNTFVNVDNGYGNGAWIGHDVSAKVYNNIIYNSVAGIGANFTGTKDYNAYFATTNTPTEANGQTGTGSPFVNEPGNDMRLSKASNAGTTFSVPYNIDIVKNTRGGDGTWDRGAFEFVSNNLVMSPPQNLRTQ